MSIFERISNITKATVHEVLNKLEDPVLMTGQYLRNMEEDIRTAEENIKGRQKAASIAERKMNEAAQAVKEFELRALSALEAGDEAAAREAAIAKIQFEDKVQQHTDEMNQAKEQVLELQLQLDAAKEEHARLKEKRNELANRAQKAKDRAAVQQPNFSRGIESGDAARGFERMEEKILEWETDLDLSVNSQAYGNPASASTAANSTAVNEELDRLKEQLSKRNS
ncbi:PspA/IM30 family protein [Paenibacillus aceti]|uniref:Membrane protein n=1 Tax=Paenibacillus aceti TaxID=1820010 RepID=A0ABQ1VY19_9BACL|nr:PspA/IM30 family protein [Paenibacillus aceti]GGG04577.1 membrane protein [Paenibacillus aceti]